MTDRTCGTCAWWDWPATVDGLKGEAGDRQAWVEAVCHYDNAGRVKTRADWCRHHATTRGWEDEEQRESDKPLFAHVMDENARLKARCQEAKQLLADAVPVYKEESESYAGWEVWREQWLEADDA